MAIRNRNAFTLIELFVVIVIISLLLSIAVLSLFKARGLAQGMVCRSNMKQWGIAFALDRTTFDIQYVDIDIDIVQYFLVDPQRRL